jgi:hypothetical protein
LSSRLARKIQSGDPLFFDKGFYQLAKDGFVAE